MRSSLCRNHPAGVEAGNHKDCAQTGLRRSGRKQYGWSRHGNPSQKGSMSASCEKSYWGKERKPDPDFTSNPIWGIGHAQTLRHHRRSTLPSPSRGPRGRCRVRAEGGSEAPEGLGGWHAGGFEGGEQSGGGADEQRGGESATPGLGDDGGPALGAGVEGGSQGPAATPAAPPRRASRMASDRNWVRM